jgi:hypothetical protein
MSTGWGGTEAEAIVAAVVPGHCDMQARWIIRSGDEQSGVQGWCFNGPGVLHNQPPYEVMGLYCQSTL